MSSRTFSVPWAAQATHGTLVQPGTRPVAGVSIDSRAVADGELFVAICGERFDGHSFAANAIARGASCLLVSAALDGAVPAEVGLIRVDDTRLALGRLAAAWRREVAPRVVGLTGSVGKTTTKELTLHVLEELGCGHGTQGNLNNDIGLPLTILRMPRETQYLVAEMGMNAPGEIDYLATIAAPSVGVITCIAPVHLEGLKTIEGIARAKAELLAHLGPTGVAIIPGDEPLLAPYLARFAAQQVVRFGRSSTDPVRVVSASQIDGATIEVLLQVDGLGELCPRVPIVGTYNASNVAAAVAVGAVLGASVEQLTRALARPIAAQHRSALRAIGSWQVIDDCYNANPLAMKAALDNLGQLATDGAKVAVLGEMRELGEASARLHREVGVHAARAGLDGLVVVSAPLLAAGALEAGMPQDQVVVVDTPEAGARAASGLCGERGWILVKASRGARLERVLTALAALVGDGAAAGDGNR